jgi:hypothetical protein
VCGLKGEHAGPSLALEFEGSRELMLPEKNYLI